MRTLFRIAVVLAFGVLVGCGADSGADKGAASGGSTGAGGVALGKDFTLAPGQSAELAKDDLKVTFAKVAGDSRCPQGVSCIQEGDATVTLSSGATSYDLHTKTGSTQTVKISGHDVKLVGLTPHPQASGGIAQGDYRATLRIE
jgi:hypothetical protein